jgi:hypothetical protein
MNSRPLELGFVPVEFYLLSFWLLVLAVLVEVAVQLELDMQLVEAVAVVQ